MSLTLGRQGGIAQPLKKRTVGQTNIAHVYAGASILGGANGGMLGDGSTNINVLGATAGSGSGAPTAFQA